MTFPGSPPPSPVYNHLEWNYKLEIGTELYSDLLILISMFLPLTTFVDFFDYPLFKATSKIFEVLVVLEKPLGLDPI